MAGCNCTEAVLYRSNAHGTDSELLAAIKMLLADIEDYQRVNHLGGEGNQSQVRARAAIAKAEAKS